MNGYNYVHSKEERLLSFLWMQQFWPCLDFCSVWVSRVCSEMFHFNGCPYCSYISLVSWCIGITFYWSQLVKSKTKSWLIILAYMLVVLHLYLRWLLVYVISTWMLWVGLIDELFFSASKCKKKLPSPLVTRWLQIESTEFSASHYFCCLNEWSVVLCNDSSKVAMNIQT